MFSSGVRLPDNLSLRPSRDDDAGFLQDLYRSTRDDLRLADAEPDQIESLIDMQFEAQSRGYGDLFPNAWYFVVERLGERIGRVVLDFGSNEVRVVDIAFVRTARGHGYGTHLLNALKQAAGQVRAPLTLSVNPYNTAAKRLYLQMGFRVIEAQPTVELMAWYPTAEEMK